MIKTDLQLTEELRDEIAKRIITARANAGYWEIVMKKAKKHSGEETEAFNNIGINKSNIKKDTLFLKVIDEALSK